MLNLTIRQAQVIDLTEMKALFIDTVCLVCIDDYTNEQIIE